MNLMLSHRKCGCAARFVTIESLEARQLLSSTTLRIGAYNLEDDINGFTTPRSGLYAVLEAIGTYNAGSGARPIDVMGLEETTSNTATVQPILTALNSYYGAGTYATSTVQGGESGSDTADGNGPNAVIYNTKTVTLLQTYGLTGSLGSSSGMYRQVTRYKFQAVGGTSASDFYVYVDHAKSGTTSADLSARAKEAVLIRNDEATLPSTARAIYVGDFNSSGTSDASIKDLLASGQGQAVDPAGVTGTWSESSSALKVLSETDTGLDYRDDLVWNTTNVATDATGLEYVAGTYTTFGNNGSVAIGKSVNSSSNTALASLSNGSTILADLTTASDHLPVFADYTVPLTPTSTPVIGSFAVTPANAASGSTITLKATGVTDTGGSISSVKFYRESNGTSGYQSTDTLVGTGTASGTTYSLAASTSGLAAGTYTYYAVATDSNSVVTTASATETLTKATGTPTSGTLLGWEVGAQKNYGTNPLAPATVAAGDINSLKLTKGSGVIGTKGGASKAWGGTGWASTATAGIAANKFVTFGLTVASGYTESLSAIDLFYHRSAGGPAGGEWQYQINSGAWVTLENSSTLFSSTSSSGAAMTELSLGEVAALQNLSAGTSVTFRLTPYGATATSGTWYIYNHTGNDLALTGSYTTNTTSQAAATVFSDAAITTDDDHFWD